MKFLPLLALTTFLSTKVFSQDYKFEIGLQAGPNITNMRYQSAILKADRHPQMGGTAGMFFQYNISNTFSLRADPAYERLSEYSGDINYNDPDGNILGVGKLRFRYDYITIPVLVRASIGKKVKYFINGGPSLGFLLNQTVISDFFTDSPKTNYTDYFQTLNFGIAGGVGIVIPVKDFFSLSFEVRNNLGLTNISKNENSNNAVKTNSTSLLVGIAYKFGSKE